MNISTLMRSSHVFLGLAYAKITHNRVPVKVALQITTRCSMRCSYCYVNYKTYQQLKDPNTEEVFKIIDELYLQGTRWLWFLGGEPMMRSDFGQIIDYAHGKGMFCDMNSNGILINKDNIKVVKKLDGVCISLDGDNISNEYYRGKGNYEKALKAIKLLRKHKIPVRIHSILTKKTQSTLDQVVKMAKEFDVSFNYCEVLKEKRDNDHSLSEKESKEFYQKYISYKKKGAPIMQSLRAMNLLQKWPKKESDIIYRNESRKYSKDDYLKCLSGDLTCFADLDGKLYSCPRTWNDGLNYHEVGFKKAWNYLAKRKCISCKCIGSYQLHLFLGLDIKSLAHAFLSVLALKN
jgi:AdoMet-dependent heme synthase